MFKIISDSACDLSQAYIEKNNIDIVPLSVSFDGENYFLDGVDITRNECYQRMVDNPKTYPKTSLPSVDLFYKAFEMYVKEDIPVVCFTISLIFSGSYNSARNAKELILEEYPNAEIHIIDSKQNTVTQGLIVDQMAKMRDNNVPLETALEKIEKVIASARIFFTVGSLDYLQMGGRIGKVAAAASKIDVKPVQIRRILPVFNNVLKLIEPPSHVIEYTIQHNPDPIFMQLVAHFLKVLIASKPDINFLIIPCIIAMRIRLKNR